MVDRTQPSLYDPRFLSEPKCSSTKENTLRIIQYQKTDSGPVLVESREEQAGTTGTSAYDRYQALFIDVPLHGGREWKTLEIDQLVEIFLDAATAIIEVYQHSHDDEVRYHQSRSVLLRWWMNIRGWREPFVPGKNLILGEMAERCSHLSTWMRANAGRPFYAGSDMRDFIIKPEQVAIRLRAII